MTINVSRIIQLYISVDIIKCNYKILIRDYVITQRKRETENLFYYICIVCKYLATTNMTGIFYNVTGRNQSSEYNLILRHCTLPLRTMCAICARPVSIPGAQFMDATHSRTDTCATNVQRNGLKRTCVCMTVFMCLRAPCRDRCNTRGFEQHFRLH